MRGPTCRAVGRRMDGLGEHLRRVEDALERSCRRGSGGGVVLQQQLDQSRDIFEGLVGALSQVLKVTG